MSVLLSGDQGFYSGAAGLYDLLSDCDVEALPGISSPVYFAAKLKKSWQDAYLVSAHGRACNVVGAVQSHAKTFALTGGNAKVLNLASNYASLTVYLLSGLVVFSVALPCAVGNICGNLLGSQLALKKGARFIRPMLGVVLTLLLVKVGMDMLL